MAKEMTGTSRTGFFEAIGMLWIYGMPYRQTYLIRHVVNHKSAWTTGKTNRPVISGISTPIQRAVTQGPRAEPDTRPKMNTIRDPVDLWQQ